MNNTAAKIGRYPFLTERFLEQFRTLSGPGIAGHFNGFEVIEVIGVEKTAQPFNVVSIAVATESIEEKPPVFLSKRLRVGGLKGFSFGVRKSFVTIDSFENAIRSWAVSGKWKPVDHENQIGDLHP